MRYVRRELRIAAANAAVVSGEFVLSEKLKEIISEVVNEFCEANGLNCTFLFNEEILLAVYTERCNLEYPGKGMTNHFYVNVIVRPNLSTTIFKGQKHWIAIFKGDDVEHSPRGVDLTALEELLGMSKNQEDEENFKRHIKWSVKDALIWAWKAEENALERYKRKPY